MVETLAELPFIGDQVGLFRAQPGRTSAFPDAGLLNLHGLLISPRRFRTYSSELARSRVRLASGAFGNAATRMEAFYVKGGTYAFGSYPDIDELFQQQAVELDHKKRAAILEKMQRLVYERSIYAPIWLLGFLNGVGPRVGESGFELIPGFAYTAPYEDITLKGA